MASRLTIPKETVVSSCDSLVGWDLDTNGIGTGEIDTVNRTEGTGSIKFTRTVSKVRDWTSTLRKAIASSYPYEYYTERVLVFDYMWDLDLNSLSVSFLSSAGSALPGTTSTDIVNAAKNIWHTVRIPMFGANLSDINYLDIKHGGDRYEGWADGSTSTLWIDNIRMEGSKRSNRKTKVVFHFDDGYLDVHTNAFPVFQRYGMVATVNMITDVVGATYTGIPMLGKTQLDAVVAAGWEIASHSKGHTNMKSSDEITVRDQMSGSKQALEALGYTVKHFSYPFTLWDEASYAISKGYYESASVGTPPSQNERVGESNLYGEPDRYKLARQTLGKSISVDNIKSCILDAKKYQTLLILYGHDINNLGGADAWTTDNLNELLSWMVGEGIETLTTSAALSYYGYL